MYEGERFNGATHLAGLALAVAASGALIARAAELKVEWRQTVACAVFAASMIAVYASSVLYHCSRGRRKALWAKADHCAIYLLIAGTYTPFALGALRGPWGWTLFGLVWGMALLGVGLKASKRLDRPALSTGLYLAMGWLVVIAVKPMLELVPTGGLWWLLAGGLAYTGGVVFFVFDNRWRYGHFVWHLFVLAGTVCHFFAVLWYGAGAA